MAKIGDELYLESLPDGLVLRTINPSESAYAVVRFDGSFFTYYDCESISTDGDDGLKCKISTKSALSVFKSPGQMDRQVEICEIKLDPEGAKLIFQLRCRHGIIKTHHLSILECKKMEATYSKNSSNRLSVHHKVFADAVGNFQASEDQVTFEVDPQTFLFRNYVDSNSDLTKLTRTQLTLRPVEFDTYLIGTNTHITFSMREFRALLAFAEAVNLPIAVRFETSGKPAVFIVDNGSTFEADFVMATERSDCDTQQTDSAERRSRKRSSRSSDDYGGARKKTIAEADPDCLDEDSHLFNFIELPDADLPEDDCNLDEIPSSPILSTQSRKINTVFRRCFEATIDPSRPNVAYNILAEDSDCD